MTNNCHYVQQEIELKLQLNSDPPSLQTPEGWYQGQPGVEGFTNEAHTYRNNILDAYVSPNAGAIGYAFVLYDDNAKSHRARIVDASEQEIIQCM
ncbi:hypothetical protein TNCV_1980281 [Trichonephila clavipes]|nr:hypothetical protein TNCV_1980281 [Trichonephila clavipes]